MLVLQPAIDAAHRSRVVQQPLGKLDRADTVLINRVLMILVELQQSAGAGEIREKAFQQGHVVQLAKERAQAARMRQQRKEIPACFGWKMRRHVGRLAADLLPGAGGDRHVVQVGQIDHLHNGRQVAPQPRQSPPRRHHPQRTDHIVRLDAMAEKVRQRRVEPLPGRGLGHEVRRHVADAVRVAEVFLHEAFHRQQPGGRLQSAAFRQAELLRPAEHVVGLAGVKVQFIAEPEQKRRGPLDGAEVVRRKNAGVAKIGEVGQPIADEADPAEQRQVAERARRALDVRLQQENRLAVAPPLFLAGLADAGQQAPPAQCDALAKKVHEASRR